MRASARLAPAALAGAAVLAAVAALLAPATTARGQETPAGDPPLAYHACTQEDPQLAPEEEGCGLFVRDPSGAERRLTDNWEDQQPAWSPDGRHVAYVRRDGGLFVVGADGSGQRQVSADVAAFPAWSPDGRWIAFLRGEGGTGHPNELAVVPADGGEGRVLRARVASFSWSPDGQRFAVLPSTPPEEADQLLIVTLDGEMQRAIAPAEPHLGSVSWSPDGTRLAYSASDLAGGRFSSWRAYVVRADGTGTHRVGGEDSRPRPHSWSPDGTRLAVQRLVDRSTTHWSYDVDVLDAATGDVVSAISFPQRSLLDPVWSTDGARLYLTAQPDVLAGADATQGPWLMVTDPQGEQARDLHSGGTGYAVARDVGTCPQAAWYDVGHAPLTDRGAIPAAHRTNVDCAVHHGIVRGFGDSTYRPRRDVRRDQMASFVAGALDAAGVPLPAPGDDRFADVPEDSPHADAIHRLAAAGIVHGGPGDLPEDAYGPALPVRRDQMASFLVRAGQVATGEQWTDEDQRFTDVPPANTHFAAVNGAAEHGLAAGFADGTFRPAAGVRRDQTATFAVRLLSALPDDTSP